MKNTEYFQVENGKVEAIYVRDFTFFVKHEALHSSTESEVNTEAWEPKKLENLKEADQGVGNRVNSQ